MTSKPHDSMVPPPSEQPNPSTLLPMLIGGLALIMVGMIAVAILV